MVNLFVMEFKKYLSQTARKLDREASTILLKWMKEAQKIDKGLVPLAKAFINACKGGKKIRGTLVRLGYELQMSNHKSKIQDDILKMGAAYEIFHAAILAHDDIIDESPERRGKKSLYKKVGTGQAITLADLGFFLAAKALTQSFFDNNIKVRALSFFSQTVIETTMGQMLDIKKADPLKVMKFKTAYYTISGPLQLGAILAGADPDKDRPNSLVGRLGELGESLGIAFQIRDDILDKEQSLTRPDALQYAGLAKQLIPDLTKDPKLREVLEGLADYLISRKK